jgi:hypothetical protein
VSECTGRHLQDILNIEYPFGLQIFLITETVLQEILNISEVLLSKPFTVAARYKVVVVSLGYVYPRGVCVCNFGFM